MPMTLAPSPTTSESCSARFATRRRPERDTFGGELADIALALGQPLMPWQRQVADVACELDPDSRLPAYREVVVTVPRQSGKTALFLAWQLHRCLSPRWAQPQRSAFTAQTGKDARDKWIDELFPLLRQAKALKPLIRQVNEGMGNEAVRFETGSVIRLLSTSTSSGHSKTLDQAVLDEIWHDVDDRREQGLRPAMITRRDAQLLVCSTAGTQGSVVLNRKVETGRAAAIEDAGHGAAYFEWSASDDFDPDDEASYHIFMPALCPDPPCRCDPLGQWRHTITIEAVRAERIAMEPPEFRRAYGNRPTQGLDERLIPAELWDAVQDPSADPGDSPTLALDVDRDRGTWAVGASDGESVEVIASDDGRPQDWFASKEARRARPVVIDDSGPASSVGDDLEAQGVKVVRRSRSDVADDCARMYDAIADGGVRVRPSSQALDDAVAGVAKRPYGDRFVWSRSTSADDITTLYAATLAFSARVRKRAEPRIRIIGA